MRARGLSNIDLAAPLVADDPLDVTLPGDGSQAHLGALIVLASGSAWIGALIAWWLS